MDDMKEALAFVNEIKQDPDFKNQFSEFLDVGQTAELLNQSKSSVYAMSHEGTLDLCKCNIGRRVTFLRDCVLDQIAQGNLESKNTKRKKQRPSRSEVQSSLTKYFKLMKKDPAFQRKYKVYLTVANMAELVKAKAPSIYEWISRGLLNCCTSRIGGNINIMLTCLFAMIARGKLNTSIRSAKPEPSEPPGEIRIETEYV